MIISKRYKILVILTMMLLSVFILGNIFVQNANAADSKIANILDKVSFAQAGFQTDAFLPLIMQNSAQTSEERAITLATADPEIIAYLENFPGWTAEAYEDEGNIWGVDFFDASGEWQGYAQVNIATGEILERYTPMPLSPEEFQVGQEAVQALVLADAEVRALLGDPALWDYSIDYDRFNDIWDVYFERGLEAWDVLVNQYNGKFHVEQIIDTNRMEEQQARRWAKDQAIELAYSVEDVWDKLDGIDDWYTFVENQGGSVWSVSFTNDDRVLFFARVDIEKQEVLESE